MRPKHKTPHRAVTKRTGDPHGDPGSHAVTDDHRTERGLLWRSCATTDRVWPFMCVPVAFHRFIRDEAARVCFNSRPVTCPVGDAFIPEPERATSPEIPPYAVVSWGPMAVSCDKPCRGRGWGRPGLRRVK